MTTTTRDHPTPAHVAELRSRHPGTLLIFRIGDDRYAAYDADAPPVYRVVAGHPGWSTTIDGDGPWVEFPADCLESLLGTLVADGLRAAVCERAKGKDSAAPVERIVTEGGGA